MRVPGVGPRRYRGGFGLVTALGDPDVVHLHGLGALTDQALLLPRRAPVGLSTHGGFAHTPQHRRLKAVWARTALRATVRLADAVWFSSASDRVHLGAAGRSGEIVPNGIDVEELGAIRRDPEPGCWITVGRVDVHKGLDDLVNALAGMPHPPSLHVIGPQPKPALLARLREQVRSRGLNGRVHFIGSVPRRCLLRWLCRAELAVFPSRFEGFGIAVAEAMAARVPVAVSRIPAHLEHVRPDVDGYVIDVRAADAARQLTAVSERSHDVVAARGQSAARRFGWPRIGRAYERAYAALELR